jgi:hypothetical protein
MATAIIRYLGAALFATSVSLSFTIQASQNKNHAALDSTKSACDIVVFSKETDPGGLNVRAGPSATSKVLGRLPPNTFDKEYGVMAYLTLRVLASENGWFLIDGIPKDAKIKAHPGIQTYRGRGWVSGKKLTVKSQANQGRDAPSHSAKTIFKGSTLDGDSDVASAHLIACESKWALVEYAFRKKDGDPPDSEVEARVNGSQYRLRGWVNRICGVQETSCSGLGDDK